ncbi:MAG: hypothetical protein ACFFCQ_07250 [Promethearchaeota archaeon]
MVRKRWIGIFVLFIFGILIFFGSSLYRQPAERKGFILTLTEAHRIFDNYKLTYSKVINYFWEGEIQSIEVQTYVEVDVLELACPHPIELSIHPVITRSGVKYTWTAYIMDLDHNLQLNDYFECVVEWDHASKGNSPHYLALQLQTLNGMDFEGYVKLGVYYAFSDLIHRQPILRWFLLGLTAVLSIILIVWDQLQKLKRRKILQKHDWDSYYDTWERKI